MASIVERIRKGWNAFTSRSLDDEPRLNNYSPTYIQSSSDRFRTRFGSEQSIVGSIYTRIAIDASSIDLWHINTDENGRFDSTVDSELHECLTLRPNIDQAARAFRIDMALSLCNTGVVAVVPVDATADIRTTKGYDIRSMRVGEVVDWFPRHVRVRLYNDRTGNQEEVLLPKEAVALVENPLNSIMNSPNSVLQRLIRKLYILDVIDEQSGSGKLDIIIQLPYTIRSEARQQQAEERRGRIEEQLKNSRYGIAYADSTEKITQLNRPSENNLMSQITYLTNMLYGQLGISEEILNGTADEQTMLNYFNRTIEPIVQAIVEEFNYKFLSKTARTKGQKITFHRDPFKLVPVNNIAEIADKFTRNEILTSNEIRGLIGYIPVKDEKADMLINSNLSQPTEEVPPKPEPEEEPEPTKKGDRRDDA